MFSCIYEYAMGISWFPMSNCVLRALKTSGEITNHFPSCHKHHHHHRHHVTIINNNNIIMSSSVPALRGGRRRQQTHAIPLTPGKNPLVQALLGGQEMPAKHPRTQATAAAAGTSAARVLLAARPLLIVRPPPIGRGGCVRNRVGVPRVPENFLSPHRAYALP